MKRITDKHLMKINEIIFHAEEKILSETKVKVQLRYNIVGTTNNDMKLKKAICEVFNVTWEELLTNVRTRRLSDARAAYCWFCVRNMNRTLKDVAKELGYSNHTSVIASISKIDDAIWLRTSLKDQVFQVKEMLN